MHLRALHMLLRSMRAQAQTRKVIAMVDEMTKNRTIVKGTGLFYLLFGIVAIATAAIMYFAAPLAEGTIEDGTEAAMIYGIILAVIGALMVVAGIIGLRAAKHDAMLKPFIYISALLVVLDLVGLGMTFRGETGDAPIYLNIIYAVFSFVAIVAASRIMNESK